MANNKITDLDEVLANVNMNEKTEMEGMADQIFKKGDSRSNLFEPEIGLIITCDVVFDVLSMQNFNPSKNFKSLAKSRRGWSTEKFVEAASGVQNQRSGGSLGSFFKERLFTPKP